MLCGIIFISCTLDNYSVVKLLDQLRFNSRPPCHLRTKVNTELEPDLEKERQKQERRIREKGLAAPHGEVVSVLSVEHNVLTLPLVVGASQAQGP